MKEYCKLYNKLTQTTDEEILTNNSNESNDLDFDIDIPEDFEGSSYYSSNAKTAQKEISAYLNTVSEKDKKFYNLKEKMRQGDIITTDWLISYSKTNELDCKINI